MLLMTDTSGSLPQTRVSFVANADLAEYLGDYSMTQPGKKVSGAEPEIPNTQNDKKDIVITPAGPIPKDKVRQVKPNETVRRNEDGSYTIVPKGQ
jgi:hypothetical protein